MVPAAGLTQGPGFRTFSLLVDLPGICKALQTSGCTAVSLTVVLLLDTLGASPRPLGEGNLALHGQPQVPVRGQKLLGLVHRDPEGPSESVLDD